MSKTGHRHIKKPPIRKVNGKPDEKGSLLIIESGIAAGLFKKGEISEKKFIGPGAYYFKNCLHPSNNQDCYSIQIDGGTLYLIISMLPNQNVVCRIADQA